MKSGLDRSCQHAFPPEELTCTHVHARGSSSCVVRVTSGNLRFVLSVGRQLWNSEEPPGAPPTRMVLLVCPRTSGNKGGGVRRGYKGGRGLGEAIKGAGLGEELPDFSVNVAKEVHVGSSSVQALILHQELTEQHLRFVLLPHDLKLRRRKRVTGAERAAAAVLARLAARGSQTALSSPSWSWASSPAGRR